MDTFEGASAADSTSIEEDTGNESRPVRDAAYLLRLYVGKNADIFERLRLGIQASTATPTAAASLAMNSKLSPQRVKWNWCAFFLGPVWFFYRKLYVEGAAIILVPILLAYLGLGKLQVGISGILGILANQYYVQRAQRRIAKIEQMPLPTEQRDALIRSRGGVSIPGLILGLVIIAAVFGLAIASIHQKAAAKKQVAALPLCPDPAVAKLVDGMVLGHLRKNNFPTDGVSSSDYREMSSTSDARTCSVTLLAPDGRVQMNVRLTWSDDTHTAYQAKILPSH